MNKATLAVITACALATSAVATARAAVLSVDFNGNNGPTETGFSSFATGNGDLLTTSVTQTIGSNTVTLSTSGELFARNRGTPADSGTFTYGELYRDWVGGGDSSGANPNVPLTLTIGGLAASTAYEITLYASDPTVTGNTNVTTLTPIVQSFYTSSGSLGTISYAAAASVNEQYSLTAILATDASGALTLNTVVTDDRNDAQTRALLNGFVVAAVPEPSSALTVALLAVAGLSRPFGRSRAHG